MKRSLLFLVVTGLGIASFVSCKESATNPGDTNPPLQTDVYWPSLAQSPWPMGRHDPQLTGRSPYVAAPTGTLIKHIQTMRVLASPVFAENGNFYFATQDSNWRYWLYAHTSDGTFLWKCAIDSNGSMGVSKRYASPLVLKNGLIIVNSHDFSLYAVMPNGIVAWRFYPPDGILTYGLTVGKDGTIYVLARNGALYALSLDGAIIWSKLPSPHFGGENSRILISADGTRLYVGANPTGLYALTTTGDILWFRPDPLVFRNSVLTCDSDNNIYFDSQDTLYCITPNNDVKWACRISPGGMLGGAIDYYGNVAVVVQYADSGNAFYLASVSSEGKLRWTYPLGIYYPENVIVDKEGTLYVGRGSGDGFYYAIRSNGTLKWRASLPLMDNSSSPAIYSDGTIYIPSGSRAEFETQGIFMVR